VLEAFIAIQESWGVHAGRDAGRAGKRQTAMASDTLNNAKTLKKLSAPLASQQKPDA
jgi:hypothetical protein